MHHRIVSILRRFKQDAAPLLDRPAILAICRSAGHKWRNSFFDPVTTIHVIFLVQILHGNTAIRTPTPSDRTCVLRRGVLPGPVPLCR